MFVFDNAKIKPFDILLVRFEGEPGSEDIRKACNSEYSHAIVYLGNSSFIEAIDPIVTLFSSQRYFFKNLDNVKVLRLTDDAAANFKVEAADKCIRSLAYCNYSRRLLFYINAKSIAPEIKERFLKENVWQGGIVCTSLISLPFFAGGIDISNTNEPFYVHFGDIERSPFFRDVTKDIFQEIDDRTIDGVYDYFSNCPTGSVLEKQSEAVMALNKLVQEIFTDLSNNRNNYPEIRIEDDFLRFTSWEDIYPNIMRWYLTKKGKEIDEMIFSEIKRSEYNNLWFEEVHNNPRLFFPAYHLITNPKQLERKEHFKMTRDSLQRYTEKLSKDEAALFNNFSACPCKTFHVLLDMYRSYSDLIRSTISHYDFIIKNYDQFLLKAQAV